MKRESFRERERERERGSGSGTMERRKMKGRKRCGWISRVLRVSSVLSCPRIVRESDSFNKWSLVLLLEA